MKKRTIPVFVPHLGCPNDCSFCNQKKITGIEKKSVSADDVHRIVSQHLKTIEREHAHIEIGFFGGSFTGIDKALQEELLGAAQSYLKAGKIDGIRLSTRPDYIDEETIERLQSFGVTTVELGVQSMDDEVLIKNLRGHTAEDTVRASRLIKNSGIALGHQVMPGLYGDSPEGFRETVQKSIALSPDCVRIYPTLVIRDTRLCEWYRAGKFTPLSLSEAVDQSKEAVLAYRAHGISVIRVGLLASDTISVDADVVAGPYHPAFGELVESAIVCDAIISELSEKNEESVEIKVHPHFVSTLVGEKRGNIKKIQETYPSLQIKIVQDDAINFGEWRILCI